jgi:hypothetical protein
LQGVSTSLSWEKKPVRSRNTESRRRCSLVGLDRLEVEENYKRASLSTRCTDSGVSELHTRWFGIDLKLSKLGIHDQDMHNWFIIIIPLHKLVHKLVH